MRTIALAIALVVGLILPGTFYSEPPRAPHFSWAKGGEVIIQITGIGPSGKTFVPQQ